MVQITEIAVPDGTNAGLSYLIEYNEDQWLRYDEKGRNFCKETWIKKATPLTYVKFVVLRLIPDPMFPSTDKELPYIEWQHKIEREEQLFKMRSEVVAKLACGSVLGPALRGQIMTAFAKYPSGTHWRVESHEGDWLAQGVV